MPKEMTDFEIKLLSLMKGEYSSLIITFNDHAVNRISVKEAVEQDFYDNDSWTNEEEKKEAVETNRVWKIQWYPENPTSFYSVQASTLEACLLDIFWEINTRQRKRQ